MNLKFLYPKNWGLVKVFRDFENYRDWIKTIKLEQANPKSKFNEWKLQRNVFYNVYLQISLEDADANLPDDLKRLRLVEMLGPLHRYLDEELGFAECLVPEFNQFVDAQGNPSLTYLVMYRFSFNKFSWRWLLKWTFITFIAVYIVTHFDLIAKIWSLM